MTGILLYTFVSSILQWYVSSFFFTDSEGMTVKTSKLLTNKNQKFIQSGSQWEYFSRRTKAAEFERVTHLYNV